MKPLYYFVGIFALIVALYIGLCAFGSKNFDLIVTEEVEAPSAVVFNLINSIEQMNLWSAWSIEDTTNKVSYNDIREGVGAQSRWQSEINGTGRQKIISSVPYQKVRT